MLRPKMGEMWPELDEFGCAVRFSLCVCSARVPLPARHPRGEQHLGLQDALRAGSHGVQYRSRGQICTVCNTWGAKTPSARCTVLAGERRPLNPPPSSHDLGAPRASKGHERRSKALPSQNPDKNTRKNVFVNIPAARMLGLRGGPWAQVWRPLAPKHQPKHSSDRRTDLCCTDASALACHFGRAQTAETAAQRKCGQKQSSASR